MAAAAPAPTKMRRSERRSRKYCPTLENTPEPELGVARLHADRHARRVRDHGGDQQAQAVEHRHAPAMQRIGLDRVDDVVRAEAPHDERAQPEHEAAGRRNDQDAHGIDADAGAEAVIAGDTAKPT